MELTHHHLTSSVIKRLAQRVQLLQQASLQISHHKVQRVTYRSLHLTDKLALPTILKG